MKISKIVSISVLVLFSTLILSAQTKDWKETFINPPGKYKPAPFMDLGKLTTKDIYKRVNDAKKSGLGGFTPCPKDKTEPKFLSADFFDRYLDILKAAKSNGMQIVVYDDINFPSGTAGNQMKTLFPNDLRKELIKTEIFINRARKFTINLPILPDSKIMAVVAMNQVNQDRVNLSEFIVNNKLEWKVPDGTWKIMIFSCITETFKGNLVDFMDVNAVKNFMTLTYDKYKEKYGSYFGNTIYQTFFDDVGNHAVNQAWTLKFNSKFKAKYGFEPDLYYPALWEDIGPETSAARVSMFGLRAELLAEGYPKIVAEWATANKILASGHNIGNYDIQPAYCYDAMKFYNHQQVPSIDYTHFYTRGREGFKMTSSAADVYDKPVVSAEVYAAMKNVDSVLRYRAVMELFTRGINFIIPARNTDAPYNNFVGRSCFMLQGGRRVSEIAILYPITSLQAFFNFNNTTSTKNTAFVSKETDYQEIGNLLTQKIHRDFTFIHPDNWVSDQCKLNGAEIHLSNMENNQNYRLFIMPGGKVISLDVLKKIKDYYDNGGNVIATTLLPSQSAEFGKDAEIRSMIKNMFDIDPTDSLATVKTVTKANEKGGKLAFIPEPDENSLSVAIKEMEIDADIYFESIRNLTPENTEVSYIHKIKNNKNFWYIVNSSETPIKTFIELRGKLNPEFWFPESGKMVAVTNATFEKRGDQVYTRFLLELPEVKSVFVVEK